MDEDIRCLWHTKDGRCSSCKARRIKSDIMKIADFDMCEPSRDYASCEFFRKRPHAEK